LEKIDNKISCIDLTKRCEMTKVSFEIGICIGPNMVPWMEYQDENLMARSSDEFDLAYRLVVNNQSDREELNRIKLSIPVLSVDTVGDGIQAHSSRVGSIRHSLGINSIYSRSEADILVISDIDAFVCCDDWNEVTSKLLLRNGVDIFGTKYSSRLKVLSISKDVRLYGQPYQSFPTYVWAALRPKALKKLGITRLTSYDTYFGSAVAESNYLIGLPSTIREKLGLNPKATAWLMDTGYDLPFTVTRLGLSTQTLKRAGDDAIDYKALNFAVQMENIFELTDPRLASFPEEFFYNDEPFVLHYKHVGVKGNLIRNTNRILDEFLKAIGI
jgi:hypothetical protein